jgi:uncharacterized membrane protein
LPPGSFSLGLLFLRLPATIIAAAGIAVIVLPRLISSPLFNTRLLAWIGYASQPPLSNDYVPVFPWIGFDPVGACYRQDGYQIFSRSVD